MGRSELITSFQDTLTFSTSVELSPLTKKAIDTSKVYYEEFESGTQVGEAECRIVISANTTFAEAQKYTEGGRVAVLNFANPVNPGGGVESGAMAQEECLCRSSNLYTCLRASHLYDEYYDYHSKLNSHFCSDRLIYTRDVTVFKDDNAIPAKLSRENWFNVDVITCAAPYLGGTKYTNPTVLRHLFQGRIKNILEAALDNKAKTIILGAFGCGAFKNPTRLVAEEFKSVIENGQYCKKFKNIVFAIKKESEKDFGENYWTFVNVLERSLLINCPTYDLPEVLLPTGKVIKKATVGFRHLPANKTIEDVKVLALAGEGLSDTSFNKDTESFDKQCQFLKWQRNNPYYRKQISILGDSISTLEGYNPLGYNIFFKGDVCAKSGVANMGDTWWGRVISLLGAELLVNNSWSGSRVSKLPDSQTLFPSGCSDERTGNLHVNDVKPDVIIVYLGTNDWGYGVLPEPPKPGFFDKHKKIRFDGFAAPDESIFSFAYDTMIKKLQNNYPEAEICCCTLNSTYMSENPAFVFPVAHGGIHIDVYNNIIRSVANRFKCKLIDFAGYHKAYDSIDGSHPTAEGMKTLATMMLRELDEKIASVLDCERGEHNYVFAEGNTGDNKYVCATCCKIKHEGMLHMKKKIVKAHIGYSDGCLGKSITLDGTTLTWRDTLAPGRPPIPDYDFSQKKRELSDIGVQLLVSELDNVDLDECVSDAVLDYPPGTNYSVFTCMYEDGSEFEYKTRFKTAPAFEQLKEILNKRCVLLKGIFTPPEPIDYDDDRYTTILTVQKNDEDSVKLDPDVTDILYPEILKLFISSSNKTITLQKSFIEVGRAAECDLNFGADNRYIARRHATFMFSNGKWYLRDNNTSNGTYINGVKLQPEKKYQLAADDEIVFARDTKLVFYKTQWIPKPPIPPIRPPFPLKPPVPPRRGIPLELGTIIEGKYKLEKLLAFGLHTVYLATVEGENKRVAIKVEDIPQFNNAAIIKSIKESCELHRTIKHPDIPTMIEMIQTTKYIYIVMDYLEGETLQHILDCSEQMEPKRVAIIAKNIAGILEEMHSLKPPIVCRDVKPSNIMISNSTDVKMFDFGIAMKLYDDGRSDEQVVGTAGYAAPEQYRGDTKIQTDIYGLGMTMYYMLTKDNPIVPGFVCKPIHVLNTKVSKELEKIVNKCVQTNYEDRYKNCSELIDDLDHFLNKSKFAFINKILSKR